MMQYRQLRHAYVFASINDPSTMRLEFVNFYWAFPTVWDFIGVTLLPYEHYNYVKIANRSLVNGADDIRYLNINQ